MNLRKGGGEPHAPANLAEAVLDFKGETLRFHTKFEQTLGEDPQAKKVTTSRRGAKPESSSEDHDSASPH
ncbi:hypothetical protein EYF80_027159 [Liparis tanakae]|uniref:Uncharacterized protein n=1 Tax=Liparis tanakae TaxID=230148 RepID=A0A4Z2HAK4_9TELE|nr:hypothetical protein EYF80_027159 [Liparis tanakae]